MKFLLNRRALALALVAALLILSACQMRDLPGIAEEDLPSLPDLPGIPDDLSQIPDLLEDLGLPDLRNIALPALDDLPTLEAPPGGILFAGPTERALQPGDRIPGTDIDFVEVRDGAAQFRIAGLDSPRKVGDSLDFDGSWPGIPGSTYNARLRVYLIGDTEVRIAGVHQLAIPDLQPVPGPVPEGFELRFPFVDGVDVGNDTIAGTTYGYLGRYERGAQLSGIPENIYPYRALGDSIEWQGMLRPGVGASYSLRTLAYGADSLRVGGAVTLILPTP